MERNNKTKSAKGRIADFEEFSQFVREQAELATDPVFSENPNDGASEERPINGTSISPGLNVVDLEEAEAGREHARG